MCTNAERLPLAWRASTRPLVERLVQGTSTRMIGTLLLVCPSDDLEGGVLSIEKHNITLTGPYVAYIPVGRAHKVSRVTNGHRFVFKVCVVLTQSPADISYVVLGQRVLVQSGLSRGQVQTLRASRLLGEQVHVNPITRIVRETGNYLPTSAELEEMVSTEPYYRKDFKRRSIVEYATLLSISDKNGLFLKQGQYFYFSVVLEFDANPLTSVLLVLPLGSIIFFFVSLFSTPPRSLLSGQKNTCLLPLLFWACSKS